MIRLLWGVVFGASLVIVSFDPTKALWSGGDFRKTTNGSLEMTLCAFPVTTDGGWLDKKCVTFIPSSNACQNTIENQGMTAWRAKFYP